MKCVFYSTHPVNMSIEYNFRIYPTYPFSIPFGEGRHGCTRECNSIKSRPQWLYCWSGKQSTLTDTLFGHSKLHILYPVQSASHAFIFDILLSCMHFNPGLNGKVPRIASLHICADKKAKKKYKRHYVLLCISFSFSASAL